MVHSQVPWAVQFIFPAVAIAVGLVMFFFVDQLFDWQIRLLQAKTYRTCTRVMGLVFVAVGLLLAWAFATGRLS